MTRSPQTEANVRDMVFGDDDWLSALHDCPVYAKAGLRLICGCPPGGCQQVADENRDG